MAEAIAQRKRTPLAIPDDVKAGVDLYRAARKRPDGKAMDFQYGLMDLARVGLKAVAAGFSESTLSVTDLAVTALPSADEVRHIREDVLTVELLARLLVGALPGGADAAIDLDFGRRMAAKARTNAVALLEHERPGGGAGR